MSCYARFCQDSSGYFFLRHDRKDRLSLGRLGQVMRLSRLGHVRPE
jgi:hypothetical protein